MLALTRKIGERIIIGDGITVTVVDVKGDSVRLGIEAPKEIQILRGEILDAIAAENKNAVVAKETQDFDFLRTLKKNQKKIK
jgi:carbon storage regulator